MDLFRNYKKEIDAIPLDSDENWARYRWLCEERQGAITNRLYLIALVLMLLAVTISLLSVIVLLSKLL